MPALVRDSVSIVLKGYFNPGIFSPSWLHASGVIGTGEYDDSEVQLITPEAARFRSGWLSTTVMRDSLQLQTAQVDEFERLRDAAVAILNLLPHVPLAVMGINRAAHFEVGGAEAWHRVGDTLAPKDLWSPVLSLPGMKSLTLWAVRPDLHSGRIQVTVEPSSVVEFGLYVAHNDHFDLTDVERQRASRYDTFQESAMKVEPDLAKRPAAFTVLKDEWSKSLNRATKVMDRVYSTGKG